MVSSARTRKSPSAVRIFARLPAGSEKTCGGASGAIASPFGRPASHQGRGLTSTILAGLLAFRPARTHRPIGVVALFVSLAVAAGIVVRVADRDWDVVLDDPGMLCAVVVAVFGLLGALKAMLTAPEVHPPAISSAGTTRR